MKMNYSAIRPMFRGGKLSQSQVENIEAILKEADKRKIEDSRQVAYILATAFHETAQTMKAIEEYGKGKGKPYGSKIKYSGKPYTTPDKIYYGRGHTQNTWYEIYETLTKEARKQGYDWDFLNKPELLLEMEPSIWATFEGMIRGLYTGKKLSDYFNTKTDVINARRIINGKDKAELIAGYYKVFHEGLN